MVKWPHTSRYMTVTGYSAFSRLCVCALTMALRYQPFTDQLFWLGLYHTYLCAHSVPKHAYTI